VRVLLNVRAVFLFFHVSGKRFAEFEMKMALSEVLINYEVTPCEKTQIPIKYVIGSFVNIPESIWLKFKKLDT
jgi:cytochrome P450 family 6